MSKVIAVSNHKGGVGKTTSVVNIGAGLNKLGCKVLLIDLDPQANLSQSLGIEEPEYNIYGAYKKEYGLDKALINITEGLDLIPSILDLSGAEIELGSEIGREYILKRLLQPIINNYDYILIDCPPSLSLLTINALTVANEVIIPLQAEYLALQGLSKLLVAIKMVKEIVNGGLEIGGVFITQFDKRKVLNRNVDETIGEMFKGNVFNTKIRENVSLAETPLHKTNIYSYNPESYGAQDYLELSKEIFNKHKN